MTAVAETETGREPPRRASRKLVFAWCLYDWGNSAFPAVVLSFIFAPYFSRAIAPSETAGTSLWGWAMTGSALAIAAVAPVVGAICDKGGRQTLWLAAFSALAVLATAALWFAEPSARFVALALFLAALANFAFETSYVFYNGMLPRLVPPAMLGRVSGWGWGAGYIGGLACMAIALLVFVLPDAPPFGLDAEASEGIRATVILAAAWFAVFAAPLILIAPRDPGGGLPLRPAIREGLRELGRTVRRLDRYRRPAWYLLAHMIYIDGLNTLFIFGGIYAAGTFGMELFEVLAFGLALNLAAGIGSAGFAWLDDKVGSKPVLILSLLAVIGLGVAILLIESTTTFWVLGVTIGAFFGPIQSASRTLMARISPPAMTSQMFGLYALSGKATAFVGPALVAGVTDLSGSQRVGMSMIVLLLVAGLALLVFKVRSPEP
jgi:UMF1 family MFS transporter